MLKKTSREILKKFDENKIISDWNDLIEKIVNKKTISFFKYNLDDRMMRKIFINFENSLAQLAVVEEKRGDLLQINEYLESEKMNMTDELSAIYNSKRWRYTAKAAALKGKISHGKL